MKPTLFLSVHGSHHLSYTLIDMKLLWHQGKAIYYKRLEQEDRIPPRDWAEIWN